MPERQRDGSMTVAVDERLQVAIEALGDIVNASRDEGLAAMCNWMRGRAAAALTEIAEMDTSPTCDAGYAHSDPLWPERTPTFDEFLQRVNVFGIAFNDDTAGVIAVCAICAGDVGEWDRDATTLSVITEAALNHYNTNHSPERNV